MDALVARGLRSVGVPELMLGSAAREQSALAASIALHAFRERLSAALHEHGVRHAYLKGTLSDALFWSGRGVRGVTDIDLLIARGDEPAATAALESLRFRRAARVGPVTDAASQERLFGGKAHGKSLDVDLHVGVTREPPYRDPGPAILARSVVHETPLGRIPGPTPEDAILQATLNLAAAKFFSGRAKLLLDAACYCARFPIAYDLLVERALRARAGWALWALLSLVEERFDVGVPADVLSVLEPSPSRAVLARRLAGVGCQPRVPTSRPGRVLVEWPLVQRPLWPAEIALRWASWRLRDVVETVRN